MNEIYLIAAVDTKFGIGKKGILPWNLKKEMKHFQNITLKKDKITEEGAEKVENIVIMGRSTWESIPEKYRPLKGRKNIVLTRNSSYKADGANIYESMDKAIKEAQKTLGTIFIIGGGRVYTESIKRKDITGLYLTKIQKDFHCDTFFPQIPKYFKKVESLGIKEENEVSFEFVLYKSSRK